MENELHVHIKNDHSELGRVVQLFQEFYSKNNLPAKITNSIDLVIDEVLNNIITYGYVDQEEHEIDIQISIMNRQLILKIEDDGIEFNPTEITEADTKSSIEDRAIGGLGIHLIRNVMDEVRYSYKSKKNNLTMKKKIEE